MRKLLSVLVLVMLSVGCAMMQATVPPTPENTTQGLILAYYETAAVVNASTDSYEQGLISKVVHDKVINIAKEIEPAINTGHGAVLIGDITTAEAQLNLARDGLLLIRTLLGGDR